jgi:hypothetical protein
MARDWIKSVSKAIAEGDGGKVAEAADKALDEIGKEVGRLRDQAALIKQLRAFYVPSDGATVGDGPVRRGAAAAAPDGYTSEERGRLVRLAALDLAQGGLSPLRVGDVLTELERRGVRFGIARPGSMVGTVLAYMNEFHHKDFNQFEYVGPQGLTVGGRSHGGQESSREQVE